MIYFCSFRISHESSNHKKTLIYMLFHKYRQHLQISYTAGFLQISQCGNEIFRFCGIFFSKEFCHIYKSVIADMFTDPEAEIFSGKYDQSCSVRQMLMISTHGVLHGMLGSASSDIHGITGHGILVTPFFLADSR